MQIQRVHSETLVAEQMRYSLESDLSEDVAVDAIFQLQEQHLVVAEGLLRQSSRRQAFA